MTWRRALVVGLVLVGGGDVARVERAPLPYSRPLRDPVVLTSDWLASWIDLRSIDPDSRAFLFELQLSALSRANAIRKQTGIPGDLGTAALVAMTAGPDKDYLLKIARRESAMNPWARADRSSAAGLFQFTENTWLCMVLQAGPQFGVKTSFRLVRTDDGRCRTPDSAERSRLLALRYDPVLSTKLAVALTSINDKQFVDSFGRLPSDNERYVLHVFGADGGTRLLQLAAAKPDLVAASILPAAARANPSLFYDGRGHARSVAEVVITLER